MSCKQFDAYYANPLIYDPGFTFADEDLEYVVPTSSFSDMKRVVSKSCPRWLFVKDGKQCELQAPSYDGHYTIEELHEFFNKRNTE